MAYTTVADTKTYLGLSSSSDDALISALVLSAQSAVDAYFRRTFEAAADATRYFDAVSDVCGRTLMLGADLCSITSVTNGNGNLVTGYVTEPRNTAPYYALTIKSNVAENWTYSTYPENAITIVGKWAYATTAPASIAHLTRWLAAVMYKSKDNVLVAGESGIAAAVDILSGAVPPDIHIIMRMVPRRVVI
jgi:hypothetical protein